MDFVSVVRKLFASVDIFIADWISKIYSFILMLADVRIVNETVREIIERVYAIIGLFMLFKLAFVVINYIINPDKTQAVGKILMRIVVSLCLIPIVPVIFEKAYELQGIILKDNIIGRIVLGKGANFKKLSEEMEEIGNQVSYLVFSNFLDYNRNGSLAFIFEGCPNIFLEEDTEQKLSEPVQYCAYPNQLPIIPSIPLCGYYLYYAPFSYPDGEGNYPNSRDVYYACKDGDTLCYDCGIFDKFVKEDIKELVATKQSNVKTYFPYTSNTVDAINKWLEVQSTHQNWTMLCGVRDGRYIYDLINEGRNNYSVSTILSEEIVTAIEVDNFFERDNFSEGELIKLNEDDEGVWQGATCVAKGSSQGDGDFIFEYNFLIATIAGLIVTFLLIIICVDISIRAIKLAFLEVMAPIPIVSYVDINSSKLFNGWVKESINTYIQLFIRLAVVFFTVLLFKWLSDNITANSFLVNVFIIIGILLFALQMPKLLSELFNLKEGGFLTIIKDSCKFAVGVAAIGTSVAGGVVANAAHTKENIEAVRDSVSTAKQSLATMKTNLNSTNGVLNKLGVFNSTMKSVKNVPLSLMRVPGNIIGGGLSSGAKTAKKLYENHGNYKHGDVSDSIQKTVLDNQARAQGISDLSQEDIKFELKQLETEQERIQKLYDQGMSNLADRLSGESNYEDIRLAFENNQSYENYGDYVSSMTSNGQNSHVISEDQYNNYNSLYAEQKEYEQEIDALKRRIKLLKKYENKN